MKHIGDFASPARIFEIPESTTESTWILLSMIAYCDKFDCFKSFKAIKLSQVVDCQCQTNRLHAKIAKNA